MAQLLTQHSFETINDDNLDIIFESLDATSTLQLGLTCKLLHRVHQKHKRCPVYKSLLLRAPYVHGRAFIQDFRVLKTERGVELLAHSLKISSKLPLKNDVDQYAYLDLHKSRSIVESTCEAWSSVYRDSCKRDGCGDTLYIKERLTRQPLPKGSSIMMLSDFNLVPDSATWMPKADLYGKTYRNDTSMFVFRKNTLRTEWIARAGILNKTWVSPKLPQDCSIANYRRMRAVQNVCHYWPKVEFGPGTGPFDYYKFNAEQQNEFYVRLRKGFHHGNYGYVDYVPGDPEFDDMFVCVLRRERRGRKRRRILEPFRPYSSSSDESESDYEEINNFDQSWQFPVDDASLNYVNMRLPVACNTDNIISTDCIYNEEKDELHVVNLKWSAELRYAVSGKVEVFCHVFRILRFAKKVQALLLSQTTMGTYTNRQLFDSSTSILVQRTSFEEIRRQRKMGNMLFDCKFMDKNGTLFIASLDRVEIKKQEDYTVVPKQQCCAHPLQTCYPASTLNIQTMLAGQEKKIALRLKDFFVIVVEEKAKPHRFTLNGKRQTEQEAGLSKEIRILFIKGTCEWQVEVNDFIPIEWRLQCMSKSCVKKNCVHVMYARQRLDGFDHAFREYELPV